MREKGFDDEKQMQRFVEYNIGTLFPGLEFIKTEFGEISGGLFRPDTIAFDTNERTFVVIEYKNKSNERALNQAKTYLNYMKQTITFSKWPIMRLTNQVQKSSTGGQCTPL